MQQERHDPVKRVRCIQEFTWTMVKLKVVIDESLDKEGSIMKRYKQLTSHIEQGEDDHYYYQGIKLSAYEAAHECIEESY